MKTYFWIYTILTAVGLVAMIPNLPILNFASYSGAVEGLLIILAMYAYIWNKDIFSPKIWYALFIILIIVWFGQLVIYLVPTNSLFFLIPQDLSGKPISVVETVFSILLAIPGLIAMHKMSRKVVS